MKKALRNLNTRAAGQVTTARGEYQESFSITELPVEERAAVLVSHQISLVRQYALSQIRRSLTKPIQE